jgi:hypothetical protein
MTRIGLGVNTEMDAPCLPFCNLRVQEARKLRGFERARLGRLMLGWYPPEQTPPALWGGGLMILYLPGSLAATW